MEPCGGNRCGPTRPCWRGQPRTVAWTAPSKEAQQQSHPSLMAAQDWGMNGALRRKQVRTHPPLLAQAAQNCGVDGSHAPVHVGVVHFGDEVLLGSPTQVVLQAMALHLRSITEGPSTDAGTARVGVCSMFALASEE